MRSPFSRLVPTSKPDSDAWHRQIKSNRITATLKDGLAFDHTAAEQLKYVTDQYLARWQKSIRGQPSKIDQDLKLTSLIDEHVGSHSGHRDVAIIACLHAFSPSSAVQHFLSLIGLEAARYLRCVATSWAMNHEIVSVSEYRIAEYLVSLLSDDSQKPDFAKFRAFLLGMGEVSKSRVLPYSVMDAAFASSTFRECHEQYIHSLLDQKRFKSAFDMTSWLGTISDLNHGPTVSILDKYFPYWTDLSTWRPDYRRISIWEESSILTKAHRDKLGVIFDLEGPDTTGQQHGSLKMSDPQCHQHLPKLKNVTGGIDRLLGVLDQAIEVGAQSIDLFILLCVDRAADEEALRMVADAVSDGNDACLGMMSLKKAFDSRLDLSNRMTALSACLPKLPSSLAKDQVAVQRITRTVEELWTTAQAEFCSQLEISTGESLAILLHELAETVKQCKWIQSSLPTEIVSKLGQMPPRETLDAIFEQISAFEDPYSNSKQKYNSARLKTFLMNGLGGRGSVDPSEVAALQKELGFWQRADTDRVELAKLIANIQMVSYDLYVRCLCQSLKEEDLVIRDLSPMLRAGGPGTPQLARYLIRRLKIRQPVHSCWISLLFCIVNEQGDKFLLQLSDTLPFRQWHQFSDDIRLLIEEDGVELPESGLGLTRETMSWWNALSNEYKSAIQLLSDSDISFTRLYLQPTESVRHLLELCREPSSMSCLEKRMVSCLKLNGSNLELLSSCLTALRRASQIGLALCERLLSRLRQGQGAWPPSAVSALCWVLDQSTYLEAVDKAAVTSTCRVIGLRSRMRESAFRSAAEQLHAEYEILIENARSLEIQCSQLRRIDSERTTTLLESIGVDESLPAGRHFGDPDVPDRLIDVVEVVGNREYELCFALTALSELQRKARGIPDNWRALIVRVSLLQARYCIHTSDENGSTNHQGWSVARGVPDRAICTSRPNIFTFILAKNVHAVLSRDDVSVQAVYDSVAKFIKEPPATCFLCPQAVALGAKLWKYTTCSPYCSIAMRRTPLEVRLHGLLTDPLTLDLLLTCAYAATADNHANFDLLPGCPVQRTVLRQVIDSFPPLGTLVAAPDLRSAIRGTDSYAQSREDLLSWLCLSFRGFMISAPDVHRIPSMPNTVQFFVLSSSPERERSFISHAGKTIGGPVFHGTAASRLVSILFTGLQVMSGTAGQLHGAASGSGVYCGDEPGVSLGYAGSTGQSWSNSALSNMRVMLGCELAGYKSTPLSGIHVVHPHDRLLVRYVFLLPMTFRAPPRRHVEQAMSTAFSRIRSGM